MRTDFGDHVVFIYNTKELIDRIENKLKEKQLLQLPQKRKSPSVNFGGDFLLSDVP